MTVFSCRRTQDEEDDLNEVGPDAVPPEVREWLSQTFSKPSSTPRERGDRPKFRSVAHVVRAGIIVNK